MLSIKSVQLRQIADASSAEFRYRMMHHLAKLAPAHAKVMGQEAFAQFLSDAQLRARAFGVRQQDTTRLWLELSMLWGIGFATDPTYAFARRIVQEDLPEVLRMRRLHRAAQAYICEVYGQDNVWFRSMLKRLTHYDTLEITGRVGGEPARIPPFLAALWPQRAKAAGMQALEALTASSVDTAKRHGFLDEAGPWLCAILALVVGVEWDRDPQYPWLVKAPQTGQPLDRLNYLRRRARTYLDAVLINA